MLGKRLERDIEREVVDRLQRLGFWVCKIKTEGRRGMPDLVVMSDNLAVFVELKSDKGRLSQNQIAMRKELHSCGMNVIVGCDPDEVVTAVLRRFRCQGKP